MLSDHLHIRTLDLISLRDTPVHRIDPRVKLLLTLLFSFFVVSFPRYEIEGLLPYFLYPVFLLLLGRVPVGFVMKRLLVLSPFVVLVGIFNPLLDRHPYEVGGMVMAGGWVSFASIVMRFILTAGAFILLSATTSIPSLSFAMEGIGFPRVFSLQIILLYRYIFVLGEEVYRVFRAREVRSFGRPLRAGDLADMMGSIFMRTLDRSERVHRAMVSRGFDGRIRRPRAGRIRGRDILFFAIFLSLFISFRFYGGGP